MKEVGIVKLILAIVHDEDGARVLESLNKGGFSVTRLSSSGGFLRAGNTTLVVGTDEDKVDEVLQLIKKSSKSRKQIIDTSSLGANNSMGGVYMPYPVEVTVGGATIFVLDVDRFEKI
jgi:uncharacterized protein YaaQ